eukprot:4332397-Prymnesium_polylepis.1
MPCAPWRGAACGTDTRAPWPGDLLVRPGRWRAAWRAARRPAGGGRAAVGCHCTLRRAARH